MGLSFKDYRNPKPTDPGYTPEKAKAKQKYSPSLNKYISVREFQKQAHATAGTTKVTSKAPVKKPSKPLSKAPSKAPSKVTSKPPVKVTKKTLIKKLTIQDMTGFKRHNPKKEIGAHPYNSIYYTDGQGHIFSARVAGDYAKGKITFREAILKSEKAKVGKERESFKMGTETLTLKAPTSEPKKAEWLLSRAELLARDPVINRDRTMVIKIRGESRNMGVSGMTDEEQDKQSPYVWRVPIGSANTSAYTHARYWQDVRDNIKEIFLDNNIVEISLVFIDKKGE